jgi:hypothetical protein
VATLFPGDPPDFLPRVPHGYHDAETIAQELTQGGFQNKAWFEMVIEQSRAEHARHPAQAYTRGTPLRGQIEARDPALLDAASAAAERALIEHFGDGPIEGNMQAYVITVMR